MHRNFLEVRVAHERCLDLVARDVLAATAQVVLLAVDEVEESVGIELADVPHVDPQVVHHLERVGGTVPVALEHHVGTQRAAHDLAGFAGRQLAAEVVDDAHVEIVVAHA